jgi:hypothetical protein
MVLERLCAFVFERVSVIIVFCVEIVHCFSERAPVLLRPKVTFVHIVCHHHCADIEVIVGHALIHFAHADVLRQHALLGGCGAPTHVSQVYTDV